MKLLFIGDVFGLESIKWLEKNLKKIINKYKIHFVVAQSENIRRRGFIKEDYDRLKAAGVDVLTVGNHVWAKQEIMSVINNQDVIRPYNVNEDYPGRGTNVFRVKDRTIRITEMLGTSFLHLGLGWKEKQATCFFDAIDKIWRDEEKTDYHLIDFHAETTSEKNVLALYVDGKVDALVGTHTHVQTNDARILPKGTAFITDVGMTGPINSAIGADYQGVYEKIRYGNKTKFKTSKNPIELNAVIITFRNKKPKIKPLKLL